MTPVNRSSIIERETRSRVWSTILAAALFAVLPGVAVPDELPERRLVVSADQATFDAEFQRQLKSKFRLAEVHIVVADREYVFAGLFEDRQQPRFRYEAGLDGDSFRTRIAELAEDGYHVSRFGSVRGDETLFFGIWEEEKRPPAQWRFDLEANAFEKTHAELTERGFRLRCFATSPVDDEPRFHGLWEERKDAPEQRLLLAESESGVRRRMTRETRNGFRLTNLLGYVDGDQNERYALLWERAKGPRQLVSLRLTDETAATTEKRMRSRGYVPQTLHAYTVRELDRYAIVWVHGG